MADAGIQDKTATLAPINLVPEIMCGNKRCKITQLC